MLVGLHDAEAEHIKRKTFPNYALMKLSDYHKGRGDSVEWWNPLNNGLYGVVYSSKVFDFTPENPYLPDSTVKGGTGYDVAAALPAEIDAAFPDYSIYPGCDFATGYITRGCPNHCRWCVVPQKEGGIKPYRSWRELVRGDSRKLVLMDNNILACDYGIAELESLAESGYAIDLNQGMDARLVSERAADAIARLKWIKYIRFSCDTTAQIDAIIRAAALLAARGVKPYRVFVYMLVTPDVADAAERAERLRGLQSVTLYAQAERNERAGIRPSAAQLEFAQRFIYGGAYRTESWRGYCEKRKLRFGGGGNA